MQSIDCLDVIIEITPEIKGVKYEYDKDLDCLRVDRFMSMPMLHYPVPYGFAPETLSDDGDPLDVMVIVPHPIIPGVRMNVRPIGGLIMEDESGQDEKILAVPKDASAMQSLDDVPTELLKNIRYFFEHYKDLDENRWVKIDRWVNAEEAAELIKQAISRYQI